MTVESTGPNKVNEYAQFPEPPETVRANEKDFRWVIGRISCLIRIPIYAVAATFQLAKTALKLSVATVTLGQLYRFEATKNWSLGGVARDAIGFISIAQRIVNSCVCVLFAPPKQYRSLKEVCSRSIGLVFKGSHHEKSGHFSEMEKVKNCWAVFLYSIPAYHKQIFESDSIVNSYATPPEPIDASTASEPDRESSTSESEETRRSSSPPLSDEENPTTAHPVVRRGHAIPKLDLSQVHDDERETISPSSISFPPGTPKPEKEIIHSDRLTPRHTAPLSAYSPRTPQQIVKDRREVRRAALAIVKAG